MKSINSIAVVLLLVPVSLALVAGGPQCRASFRTTTRLRSSTSTELQDGLIKTISKAGSGIPLKLGDIASIKYSCYLPNEDSPPFATSDFQKVVSTVPPSKVARCEMKKGYPARRSDQFDSPHFFQSVGDGAMIDGWEKAISTMSIGERAVVRITNPELGYGSKGVPPLIPPNAEIELDMEILDAQPPLEAIDFDTLAMSDQMTPRTAGSIAAAYEQRQQQKALEPQKEGLEAFIEKVRNFYFFGFFEGETGQQAPWYLRPSITFPIAFLVVGAAFYVSLLGGAISERGAPTTDELDSIILTDLVLMTQLFIGNTLSF
jgi:hypothetical protein